MKRREFLGAVCGAAGCLAGGATGQGPVRAAEAPGSAPAPGAAPPRPNVVVIVADDLARNELSCLGGTNIRTPHIDSLARDGLTFTHAFASTAMCVPLRSSLFTGLYPVRHGACRNHAALKEGTRTLPLFLQPLGYRVGITGKIHVRPMSLFPIEVVPGFIPNCVAQTTPDKPGYRLDGVRQFLSASPGKPFCLFVCSIHPHAPWSDGEPGRLEANKLTLPPHLADTPKTRAAFAKYLAEIQALDAQVAQVLQTLDELKLRDNTLVIFAGEQGPQFPRGKWTCYDYGLRSAFIARWPGRIQPGSRTGAMIQYEDVLPTLIELAGGRAAGELDGRSFASVLTGRSQRCRDHVFAVHNNVPEGRPYPIRAVRDGRYKLILNLAGENDYHEKHVMDIDREDYWTSWEAAAAAGDAGARRAIALYRRRPAVEMYDADADPWELTNLADRPELAERRADLEKRLRAWMAQQGDTGAALDVEPPPGADKTPARKAGKKAGGGQGA